MWFLLLFFILPSAAVSIGVNYGTLGNNLPDPTRVSQFLQKQTTIDRIKLFDANPEILKSFVGTNIKVTVTSLNSDIPSLSNGIAFSREWVRTRILPFRYTVEMVSVGNEVVHSNDKYLISRLVPAMRNVRLALVLEGLKGVRVTTAHSLGILSRSQPPSQGLFRRGYDRLVFEPMLRFLAGSNSTFMVNPYPYFGYSRNIENYTLFGANSGVHDKYTGITYMNMFDAMLDAVHSAMKSVGYPDVAISIGETGWPSLGDQNQPGVSSEYAAMFNGRLVKHVNSGKGTPLMPNRNFETFLFGLFNENLKPGPIAERNFGLFSPDFSPVYDIGIMRANQGGKRWCVASVKANDDELQVNIDYACSQGVDCKPIQLGGICFEPRTIRAHASFVMNSYFQIKGRNDFNCDFRKTGQFTSLDPSSKLCKFLSWD